MFSLSGNDIFDRGRTAGKLLRQQPPWTFRGHGRVQGSVARQIAKSLEALGPTADRIQRLWYDKPFWIV